MSDVDVSVIIPVHNRAHLIGDAIRSALNQDPGIRVEVIVIDDGSADGSAAAAQAVSPLVRVLRKDVAGGPAAARNMGLRIARGRYIAFLDSDDVYLPNRLSSALAYFREHPEVAVVFAATENEKGEANFILSSARHQTVYWANPLRELLSCGNPMLTLTVTVRADALKNCGYFDESLICTQDYELWLRLTEQGPFAHLNQVVAVRRNSPKGQMTRREARLNPALVYRKAWQRANLSDADKARARPMYANYVTMHLRQILRERDGRLMLEHLALFKEALGGIERLAWGMLARLVCLCRLVSKGK